MSATKTMETFSGARFPQAPPPYRLHDAANKLDSPAIANGDLRTTATPTPRLALPCVLPQITKLFRGAFYSLFVRAWVPTLEQHRISQTDFLTFIDGLNECFIAHPIFQAKGAVGGVMSMFYGIVPVQWTGVGLQFVSGAASAATSYIRTRAYVKAVNTDVFKPAGLPVRILTTKKMLAEVGYGGENLTLRSRQSAAGSRKASFVEEDAENILNSTDESSIQRRIKALEGLVMPLITDVPTSVPPDNFLREAKQDKKQRKADEKYKESLRKAERRSQKSDAKIEKLQAELASQASPRAKTQRKLDTRLAERGKKVEKKLGKGTKKQDRLEKRENKRTNGIRWIVISNWEGDDTKEGVDEECDIPDESSISSKEGLETSQAYAKNRLP